MEILIIFFISAPVVSFIWFLISLIGLLKCPAEDVVMRRSKKKVFIISAVVFGIFASITVGLFMLLTAAIVNM